MDISERQLLRELAHQYAEIAALDIQDERRDLWRQHNSLVRTRPLIYIRAFAWHEMAESRLVCTDPILQHIEDVLRQSIFRHRFGDDYIVEPWIVIPAAVVTPPEGVWGVPLVWTGREGGGAGVWDAPIKEEADLVKLASPQHVIDEVETARRLSLAQDAIGDILHLVVDRGPAYRMWEGDISTHLAYLCGLEQVMWDMMDRPQWLHDLLTHMRDGILRTHQQAEEAGDWRLCAHQNQAMPYAQDLPDPSGSDEPVGREQLWTYCASQELTAVGPAQFDEFMLQYQIPLMAPFGLAAYGCCEDLTQKIPLLRQIPNLRRIGISPMADVAPCAEQIGTDYVFSYRPSPADMVAYGFDEERVRQILIEELNACAQCHVDITLKDVETVQSDPTRVERFVQITREIIGA